MCGGWCGGHAIKYLCMQINGYNVKGKIRYMVEAVPNDIPLKERLIKINEILEGGGEVKWGYRYDGWG